MSPSRRPRFALDQNYPLEATGLLLAHLPWIAKQQHRHKAQVWVSRTVPKLAEDPWDRLKRVAAQQGESDPKAFLTKHKITSPLALTKQLLSTVRTAGDPDAESRLTRQHRARRRR